MPLSILILYIIGILFIIVPAVLILLLVIFAIWAMIDDYKGIRKKKIP
jgi:hypothetical protein